MHRVRVLFVACLGVSACEVEGREFGTAPRSLADTELDGVFAFDDAGKFVFDEGAQRAFDYFLTTDGELAPEELDAWVAERLHMELGDGDAFAQVMVAFRAYLQFRAVAAAALNDPTAVDDPEQLERRLLAALELHLGGTPVAEAERQRIEQGFALRRAFALPDADARAAELERLNASEAERFASSRAGRYLAGRRAIEQARRAGADAETIAALRVQYFDAIEPGAAERLAVLDAERRFTGKLSRPPK
jgi:lipase chaperone LimK